MSEELPDPHGTVALVDHYVRIDPDTPRRMYGRAMIRRMAAECDHCHEVDEQRERLRHMHTDYHRKGRP